ncbi:tRNA(Ile)-lysidine synthase [Mucilaginibacter frigoritolerans]|uniref:tRNA(Ile)-lysidine synthase n=1 Tax=Mucilaginibacter frigoritolerans TaxID=652788 RepID=A0A562U0K2_9SPHI|nr:tRNA lysidine(34) synthetase TilS [Mucilaginibacter frigoritolerans]TWI99369.1 tRNA(Ile)-lysidine synthase [Mucilaginibacter frigoritolerans]
MLPVNRFTQFIAQNNLFSADNKILAAVSGGMDSVVMAHLLKVAGFNFSIAHCNFQLRGDEAVGDQAFCNDLALQLRVPFHTINFDTVKYVSDNKVSTQMAARELRYQWFEQLRQQHDYSVIALAHHQNDAIETILLNLTRGTGIAGMHGILPKNGLLVRPLLFLTREEIQQIITDNRLAFVEDSSNASAKYARNKIRLEVIPKLKELNPNLESTFNHNLEHFRGLELLLQQKVAELKHELFIQHDEEIHIPLAKIKMLEPKRLLLFNLLQEYGFNETSIDDLISSLDKHSGRIFESAGFNLLLDRERLIISPNKTALIKPVQFTENTHEVDFGSYKLTLLHDDSPLIVKNNPMAASVDADLLQYPLTLRTWQQGDYFYPIGMRTRKKLSDFFIDQKVPLHEKNNIPLLVNANDELIWIGGYRPDDRYKVSKNTKKVTIFELIKK